MPFSALRGKTFNCFLGKDREEEEEKEKEKEESMNATGPQEGTSGEAVVIRLPRDLLDELADPPSPMTDPGESDYFCFCSCVSIFVFIFIFIFYFLFLFFDLFLFILFLLLF